MSYAYGMPWDFCGTDVNVRDSSSGFRLSISGLILVLFLGRMVLQSLIYETFGGLIKITDTGFCTIVSPVIMLVQLKHCLSWN